MPYNFHPEGDYYKINKNATQQAITGRNPYERRNRFNMSMIIPLDSLNKKFTVATLVYFSDWLYRTCLFRF